MKKIEELLGKPEVKRGRGGVNSERADVVGQLIYLMEEHKTLPDEVILERRIPGAGRQAKKERLSRRMKYWLGRTRKLPPQEIYLLIQKAKNGTNPGALFNWLLKNYGKEIKK